MTKPRSKTLQDSVVHDQNHERVPKRAQTNQVTIKARFIEALSLVPEISEVETTIRSCFTSDVGPMHDIPDYLLSLGGKRIRPILTLLCAKALGGPDISPDLIRIAAGIELIHMATLMHDDIIDQSPTRRHKPSPFAKFGLPLTLLSGDFLLTRAFGLCAKLDDTVIAATEQACIELVEGEALETPLHRTEHTRESSLFIANRKTASLFRLGAFCAAHLTNTPSGTIQAAANFGQALGVAFQIVDDILDVQSDENTLGKPPGIDILERKPSLVNILWLATGSPLAGRLKTAPQDSDHEREYVQASLQEIAESGVLLEATKFAKNFGSDARHSLEQALQQNNVKPSQYSQALHAVIDFALDRVS